VYKQKYPHLKTMEINNMIQELWKFKLKDIEKDPYIEMAK
jgi:hypothetical protein